MSINEQILLIIQRALKAELTLIELYSIWPDEVTNDSFYESIYNDVESAVEHTPFFLWSNGVDFDSYRSSYDYYLLLVDEFLLQTKYSNDILAKVKEKLSSKRINHSEFHKYL